MADVDIQQLIAAKAKCADDNDFLGLLGVTAQSSKPEIQKAYFDLAKQLHPDRVSRMTEEEGLREVAGGVFKALSEAYNTLMDPRRRDKFLKDNPPDDAAGGKDIRTTQELISKKPTDPGVTAREAAKIFYHRGMMAMKKGDYAEAERLLRKALESDAESARYALQLGWAIFQNTEIPEKKRFADARGFLEQAVGTDPENPEGHYFMARYYKATGDVAGSEKHLKTALQYRKNYIEARRELRLLQMRQQKKSGANPKGANSRPGKGKGKGKAEPEPARWPFGLDRFFRKK